VTNGIKNKGISECLMHKGIQRVNYAKMEQVSTPVQTAKRFVKDKSYMAVGIRKP
jgi:hypothetical protein